MAESIDILVKLVDEASANLNRVQKELETLEGTAEDASKGFDTLNSSWDDAVKASTVVAGAVAAAGAAVFGFGVIAVNAARESTAVQNQLNAVLTSTGMAAGITAEAANALANSIANVTNFDDEAILAGENLLLTFTNIGKDVFPLATQAMVDMAAAMGTDVKSGAIQLGKALNDPVQGISALSRVGVSFTKQQEDVIKALVATGDVAGAQGIILAELSKEFGGSAEAIADPLLEIKDRMGDLVEGIGMKLLPFINDVAEAFLRWVDSMGGVDGILQSISDKVNELTTFLSEHQAIVYIVAGALLGALTPALIAAAMATWGLVTAAASLTVALLPYIIIGALIGGAIYLIVQAVKALIAHLPEIQAKWKEVWDNVTTFFTAVWNAIVAIFTGIWNSIVAIWDGIKTAIMTAIAFIVGLVIAIFEAFGIDIVAIWGEMKENVITSFNSMKDGIAAIINFVSALWTTVWGGISTFASTIWTTIKNIVIGGITAVRDFFAPAIQAMSTAWNGFWTGASGVVTSVWEGIKSTVASGVNWVISKINALIEKVNSVISKGAGVLGIKAATLPTIPMLAKGGDVIGAGAAMVGEEGPEILSLPRGARVTPLKNGGGVGAPSITINIVNPTVMSTDDVIEKIGDPIMQAFKQHFAVV